MTPNENSGMGKLADNSGQKATERLYKRELEILKETTIDWEKLRPQVTNSKTYDKLIAAVEESTRKNESITQLKDRIKKLGNEAVGMARSVAKLAKPGN